MVMVPCSDPTECAHGPPRGCPSHAVLASLLLDFTKAESDDDEVRSLGDYADTLELGPGPNCCRAVVRMPDKRSLAQLAKNAAMRARDTCKPVRLLIKHKPVTKEDGIYKQSLLPFVSPDVLQLPKVLDFQRRNNPVQLQAHYLGLFMVDSVTMSHITLVKREQ